MVNEREWDFLFILCWEMGFELNFWWEREGIENYVPQFCFEMGIALSLNEKYEECKTVGVGSEMQSQHIKSTQNYL